MKLNPPLKKSLVTKRSVKINGHKTSVSLEDEFWTALKQIAANQNISIEKLVLKINSKRQYANLSSAIRLFVLGYYCQQAEVIVSQRSHRP